MEELLREITALTSEWYTLIGPTHHKDRDCHWYIETKWSYGNDPKYSVQHFGYVADRIEDEYDSYDKALKGLRDTLTYWIDQEKLNSLSDI